MRASPRTCCNNCAAWPKSRGSISDYVTATLREAVQRDIADMEIIRLSREASERFADALINPPDPVPAMRRAFEHRRQLVKPG